MSPGLLVNKPEQALPALNGCGAAAAHGAAAPVGVAPAQKQPPAHQAPAHQASEAEREKQTNYWKEHTPAQPTVETMMLDSSAKKIDERERPEVLGLLGSVAGKRVLELGAGIGRFTGELCRSGAATVMAVDFMEASIAENRRLHEHLYPDQLSLAVQDVTQLQLPPASFDVIFTNWLLMYLADDEVASLAQRMLTWLSPGGVLFFRESCFKQSGDKPRKDNPTHYRNPREYFAVFDGARCEDAEGGPHGFELLFSKCVDTYVALKHNQNQICWKWRKAPVVEGDAHPHTLRHFLDGDQYSTEGLLMYEAIYGRGFVSCGGEAAARQLLPRLQLGPGDRVLDVGCGTGGAAHLMSQEYGAYVHGLDVSVNCLLTCLQRASVTGGSVVYEVADVTQRSLEAGAYDAVHCRDMLLHIQDKAALLAKFYTWLRPGGRLLITDYAVHATPDSAAAATGSGTAAFATAAANGGGGATAGRDAEAALERSMSSYVAGRGYHLWSAGQYEAALEAAGYQDVCVQDATLELVGHLERELGSLVEGRAGFKDAHGKAAYATCLAAWEAKLARARAGVQRWVLVLARKPTAPSVG